MTWSIGTAVTMDLSSSSLMGLFSSSFPTHVLLFLSGLFAESQSWKSDSVWFKVMEWNQEGLKASLVTQPCFWNYHVAVIHDQINDLPINNNWSLTLLSPGGSWSPPSRKMTVSFLHVMHCRAEGCPKTQQAVILLCSCLSYEPELIKQPPQ